MSGPAHRRVEVTLVPSSSTYLPLVREAAREAGADFVRVDVHRPGDLEGRIVVADLTRVLAEGRLGPRVIAISPRLELDCYDVVPPEQVRARLRRTLHNLVEREALAQQVEAERSTITTLNEIGYALSGETRLSSLLDTVLSQARAILAADAGSIYLVEDGRLHFVCSQNDTLPFRVARAELPIDDRSLAGAVALRGEPLQLDDVAALPADAPFRPDLSFDHESGYRTRSMLLVPMKDRDGAVIGVLALVNHTPPEAVEGEPQAFPARAADIAGSIASQAAVAISNHRLFREIRRLFDGFVNAAIAAVESRDPSTAGHSHRVAALATALARAISASALPPFDGITFSEQDITELGYAAMLHDFGKVGVREDVLLKGEKLYAWELAAIESRFERVGLHIELDAARGEVSAGHAQAALARLHRDLGIVRRLTRAATRPTDADRLDLLRIREDWVVPRSGEPVLDLRDIHRLCIPYGTLDEGERREIERHVTHSYEFLRRIPWTSELARIPDLAYAHHEKLDGTGYPLGIRGEDIPLGAQIISIADIFDALTASDRPYKPATPVDEALAILREEADRGRLIPEAVELFAAARPWEAASVGLRGRSGAA